MDVDRQQREYRSFTPFFINRPFVWENRQIDLLVEQAAKLLGELNQASQWILTDFQNLEQQLRLPTIQCELPLQEIYERVPFPE